MLLFFVAVVVTLLGLGAYDLYNPGTHDVVMAGHHFVAVPDWAPIAAGATVPLSLFLVYALWTSLRIGLLKRSARRAAAWAGDGDWEMVRRPAPRPAPRTVVEEERPAPQLRAPRRSVEQRPAVQPPPAGIRRRRASQAPPSPVSPQPAPKRSWLPPE